MRQNLYSKSVDARDPSVLYCTVGEIENRRGWTTIFTISRDDDEFNVISVASDRGSQCSLIF